MQRTSYKRPHQDLARSSHMYQIMQGSLRWLQEDLYKETAGEQNGADGSQDRGPHFVRACGCAVEMHIDISQKPFYARILGENAAPQKLAARFVRACASKCTWTSQTNHLWENVGAVETHMDISKEPFYARILRKNAAAQEHDKTATLTFCKAAQSKRTYQKSHFMPRSDGAPWSNPTPGLYTYRPTVWTHGWGNNYKYRYRSSYIITHIYIIIIICTI